MSGALLVAAKQAELSSGEVLASKFGAKSNKSLEKPHPNLKSVDSLKKPDGKMPPFRPDRPLLGNY
jgi:hypothetical protein